ncbi:MAG: hypothetical protein JXB88_13825 [Spirochaetales bacterium]|nr:hypothetical protein [Spirochaetales bacterium]
MAGKVTIQPFDNNFKELSALIHQSWKYEHKNYVNFTPEYLEYLITSPMTIKKLTLGAYSGKELVSFILSIEKEVMVSGKKYKALFNTLATTNPEYSAYFPYIKIKNHCIKELLGREYDLCYGFAANGIRNNEIEQLIAKQNKLACQLIKSFGALYKVPEDPEVFQPLNKKRFEVKSIKPEDITLCINLIRKSVDTCEIYEIPDQAAFSKRLMYSKYNDTLVALKDGIIEGLINYSKLEFKNKNFNRRVAVIYNVFVDRLNPGEIQMLFKELERKVLTQGIEGISIPDTGYFNSQDILALGYLKSFLKTQTTNLYFTGKKDYLDNLKDVTFYLEII